ncbi:MAG TPA: L-seryl-tRNA(Sec) selenium transferase, partial [Thermoanaerobaculia bacterium]|nr:L-seryl-tRNA(Sec) selenium transferase [Thermoanaerobaculia bacterium]
MRRAAGGGRRREGPAGRGPRRAKLPPRPRSGNVAAPVAQRPPALQAEDRPGTQRRRRPPSMDALLSAADTRELLDRYGREAVKDALRAAIADGETEAGRLAEEAAGRLERRFAPSLKPVINATGVLLHTNLGRAPLSPAACAAVAQIAPGYSTLELDSESGGRGRRQDHVRASARKLFGCEDVIAVNNNASAIFLALCVLARGRRVLVSRGELVAIGGSFK